MPALSKLPLLCCFQSTEKEDLDIESVKRKPIRPDQFLEWLRRKDAPRDLNLEVKALLNHKPDTQCIVSTAPENLWLNNQKDIVPYDHARISLREIPQGFTTDYINANYIDGFCKSKEYIATQGPQYRIASAFWQMVWQEQVRCIVMATGLFEHATQQCDKYWEDIVNDYGQVKHGKITIRTINTISIAHLTIRTLQICKDGNPGCRIIEHFEMSSWEMDDTIDAGVILDSRRRILKYMDSSSGPLLVHCRSGGARTAIFIAVDYCLKQLEVEDYVDVFGAILHMHTSRKNMIRTPVQYRLIYDTLALYMQCSNSIYTASSLIQRLSEKGPNRANEFAEEFHTLNQVVPKLSIGDCAGGHRQENRSKSRDIMLQPPERARPYLLSNDKSDDSDFINGVYVDGYWNRNNYIVTQWPMKNTVRDIWRLVYDYKVHTIVLLNDVKFSRTYPCFWPKEVNQEKKYGPIGVKYCRTWKYPDMVVRVFRVRKNCVTLPPRDTKDESRPVRIFQLLNWPKSNKVPPNTMSFAYLLGLVEEWQSQINSNSPVVVISKDGYSGCGMYCAISICCDRLKDDREVDIMNAVRVVKKNRPQLVPTLAEYNYCYTFIASLLEHLQEIGPKIVVTNPEGSKETDNNDQEEGASEGRRSSRRTSDSSSFFTALDMDTSFNIGNLTQFHSALSPLHLPPCSSPMTRNAVLSATDTCSLYDLESSQTFLKVPWPPRENINGRPHMFEADSNCIRESVTLPFRNKARNIAKSACNSRASRFIRIPSAAIRRKDDDIRDEEIRGWEMQEVMNGICGKPTARAFLSGTRKPLSHRQIHAARHDFMNGHCSLEEQHRKRHEQIE